jgi:hypothetical protein
VVTPGEVGHGFSQFSFGHLAVGGGYFGLGHDGLELAGDVGDALHPVMDKEDLAVSFHFSENSFPD